jgi:hypothetical protein
MKQLFRLLIFLNQPYMSRATNSPIHRSTFWLYIQLLVQCTDTAADRCIVPKAVYTVKKCSWGWENLSPETWFKKINKWKSCCILLVAYIVLLVMHGHTNIKFRIFNFWRISPRWKNIVKFWRNMELNWEPQLCFRQQNRVYENRTWTGSALVAATCQLM